MHAASLKPPCVMVCMSYENVFQNPSGPPAIPCVEPLTDDPAGLKFERPMPQPPPAFVIAIASDFARVMESRLSSIPSTKQANSPPPCPAFTRHGLFGKNLPVYIMS